MQRKDQPLQVGGHSDHASDIDEGSSDIYISKSVIFKPKNKRPEDNEQKDSDHNIPQIIDGVNPNATSSRDRELMSPRKRVDSGMIKRKSQSLAVSKKSSLYFSDMSSEQSSNAILGYRCMLDPRIRKPGYISPVSAEVPTSQPSNKSPASFHSDFHELCVHEEAMLKEGTSRGVYNLCQAINEHQLFKKCELNKSVSDLNSSFAVDRNSKFSQSSVLSRQRADSGSRESS